MAGMVPFTDNYSDHSNSQGYQFEFFCERCGNGYQSDFKRNVVQSGGRLAEGIGSALGGLFGGSRLSSALESVGSNAQMLQDQNRSQARDKALAEAVAQVREYFTQCHRCGEWVCNDVCWNTQRGLCVKCAPKLDQEIAGMQASAQLEQLRTKIEATDYTTGVNVVDEGTGLCPQCGGETGGGKFCQSCGFALAAAPKSTKKFCTNCGTELKAEAKFCAECGTPAA
jgi:hypothetical protein